ncbi:Gfo/Idh/MocA family oxidoreductase [Pseudanabaena sp. FACHB-2040]|uniref:Gfo/Idh/MocA family protein n=1 Tax=Pseudanabaena sp. FACHB-2040 TaxID=2692859 RepID=UPI001687CD5F|nr:Gfo/Idh/MocA family oxidoreductase [Pseudanabaena sp. FACHB-2040]MBD2255955.1 Gfo/Idh/MocA family oxidoreductase [Pseudanabaena sp. FACHB-2040]
MVEATIGVAVVGTGFGQKVHIPGLQAHHRTEVVAVYHRDGEKGRAIAQAHDIPHACTTLEDLLALPEVQAVSIATPPFLHFDQARDVLTAGKHLLLEKPTALTLDEARALADLAERNRVAVTMDFEFRFVPAWQRLADLLQEGYVGQPRLVKVDWLVPGRADASRPWNWYARKDQGGGALGAFASHTFDYIAWLFGSVRRLSAQLYTAIPQRPDPATGELKPVDADDTCSLQLELTNGTPCQITISSVAYAGRGHWLEVYGDRGTLVLGSDNLSDYVHGFKLYGSQNGAPLAELPIPERLAFPKTYPDGRIAPFVRVVDHWVEGIARGRSTAPSIVEGVHSQLMMDLAYQSNTLSRWVDVPQEM